jgi:hypothetical protein
VILELEAAASCGSDWPLLRAAGAVTIPAELRSIRTCIREAQ